jgi:signal transduction histidine kinase
LDIALLLIYFVYGLSFLAMGLALLLEIGRAEHPEQARGLAWLAAFSLSHGTHEWFEAYLMQARAVGTLLPGSLDSLRLGLLAGSFACLLIYAFVAFLSLPRTPRSLPWLFGLPVYIALGVMAAAFATYRTAVVPWASLLDAAARYALALPAALLACLALRARSVDEAGAGRMAVATNLRLAAAGFGVYAVTQIFVHRLPFFPADLLNLEAFQSATDVPIQALRATASLLIAWGLLRALQEVERDRQRQLEAAHRARLDALEQRDALRRDLIRRIVRSQEEERARVARDVHDGVAQTLSALSLGLAALRTRLRKPDTTSAVDHLQDLSHQMAQALFRLVRDLRPSQLEKLGLLPALRQLIAEDLAPQGIHASFETHLDSVPLDEASQIVLFRFAQEALINVSRHAGVDRASVALDCDGSRVILRVCDDGRGFDPAAEFLPPKGWGLAGMRERVESVGGTMHLSSAPGAGTVVEASIPIQSRPREA